MVTKGVASVPSPVRNLSETSKDVDHERFVEAVAKQFAHKYGVSNEVQVRPSLSLLILPRSARRADEREFDVQRIDEGELDTNEYVRDVVDELKVRLSLSLLALTGAHLADSLSLSLAVVGLAVRSDARVHARDQRLVPLRFHGASLLATNCILALLD